MMDIAKKNIASLLCGVVAIVAIVALFWPVGGMYDGLQAHVDKSKQTYSQVESLRNAPRKLPTLILEGDGEQLTLDRFPNQKVVAVGLDKTRALTEQSKKMLDTVSQLNVREPLVPGTLPWARSQPRTEFPEIYLRELGQTELGWKTGLPLLLNATKPPTSDDITDVASDLWEKKFAIQVYDIGGTNNLTRVSDEFQLEIQDLPRREQEKRAREHVIYLDEDSLAVSSDIQLGQPPEDTQIWFAQTVLWIEQDVVKAINDANDGATTVMEAPIKHLVSLRVPFGPEQYVLPVMTSLGGLGGEVASLPLNANGVPEVFAVSPTGRVCNDLYDVVHLELVLRVDFRKIPQILAELERNRLFTVLSTGVASIDGAEERKQLGYVYGNDPVAEITLQCEALFLRSWTVDKDNDYKNALMPKSVRLAIGAQPAEAGEGNQGVPAMPGMPMPGVMPGEEF